MNEARLLDDQLLAALEQRWREQGAQTPDHMEPGLTDEQIDEITAPLGFPLPDELRTLYRWHNGSGRYEMAWLRALWALDTAVPTSLKDAVSSDDWRPGWMQILSERPAVLVDCLANGQHGPAPVWNHHVEIEAPTRPVFASVGDMVSFWIELIDDDLMYWDGRLWQIRDDRISDEAMQRLSGVPQD
ncbi:SMI1/KNR4 family protein [Baekduia sp. Peel2402]|uniref:SMI1/KNR4 family protein n=1 Tax=Baekduia sp. Peel2402 TaxID=3458296 RepID=UPI00403EACBC